MSNTRIKNIKNTIHQNISTQKQLLEMILFTNQLPEIEKKSIQLLSDLNDEYQKIIKTLINIK